MFRFRRRMRDRNRYIGIPQDVGGMGRAVACVRSDADEHPCKRTTGAPRPRTSRCRGRSPGLRVVIPVRSSQRQRDASDRSSTVTRRSQLRGQLRICPTGAPASLLAPGAIWRPGEPRQAHLRAAAHECQSAKKERPLFAIARPSHQPLRQGVQAATPACGLYVWPAQLGVNVL